MLTYHVLYNPRAGSGRGTQAAHKLKALLPDGKLLFRDITEIDDYGAFFRSLQDDDRVVIAGGDGTLNRYTAPLQIDCNIYYFATGSGNDFLTDIGGKAGDAPRPINQYLQDLPSVYVGGKRRYFLNGVGYGIDGYCCLGGRPSAGGIHKAGELCSHCGEGSAVSLQAHLGGRYRGLHGAYIQARLACAHYAGPLLRRRHDPDATAGSVGAAKTAFRHGVSHSRQAEGADGISVYFQGRAYPAHPCGGGADRAGHHGRV